MRVTTEQIFPTIIQQIDLSQSEHLAELLEVINSITPREHGLIEGLSSWGMGNLLHDPRLDLLHTDILSCVNDYAQRLDLPPLIIGNSWFNRQQAGDRVLEHRHGLSVISGAFYIECDQHSSGLEFHDPVEPQRQYERTVITNLRHQVPIYKGLLVLFPSWLSHSTLATKSPRTVVSFNTNYA